MLDGSYAQTKGKQDDESDLRPVHGYSPVATARQTAATINARRISAAEKTVKASLDGEATISHQPVIVLQVPTGAGFGEKRTVKPVAQHSRQRDERQLVDNHRQLLGRDQTDGAEQQQRGQQPAAEAGF